MTEQHIKLDPNSPAERVPPGYRIIRSPFWGYFYQPPEGEASEDFKSIQVACQRARGHYRRIRGAQRRAKASAGTCQHDDP